MNAESPLPEALSKNRGWLVAGGILSVIVGFLAIAEPYFFSLILTQFIGAFCLVNGVISLFMAVFGKGVAHRVLNALLALIRVAFGLVFLIYVSAAVNVLTLFLAAFFLTEGIFCLAGAFKMRDQSGWIWVLLNGLAALLLGAMVYAKWPNDSEWVIGLLYGINSIFAGTSLFMLGLSTPKASK